jgi:hypothetical protein
MKRPRGNLRTHPSCIKYFGVDQALSAADVLLLITRRRISVELVQIAEFLAR